MQCSCYNLDNFYNVAAAAVSLEGKEDDLLSEGIYIQLAKFVFS